ncbi:Uncharacterised protein [uncultured archaeon]|nr:Uncharacterised protein [uncultured archaeon]
MTLAKLQGDLLKVREDLTRAKKANEGFERVLQEMSILKSRSIANPATKSQLVEELKGKEILDLFSSVELDFEELRQTMAKQSIEKEGIIDFIESIRTKKTFSFEDTQATLSFLEKSVEALDASHVAVKPEFIGLIDLGPLAVEHKLMRSNSGVIVEKERFSEFLVALLSKKMFHDLVFETDRVKIVLKNAREIMVEAENSNIRTMARIAKPTVY